MENSILKFKTNINCQNCIAAVKPHLDKLEGIEKWVVDTENPEKILTVESSGAEEEEIMETVMMAGYRILPFE